MSQLQTLYKYQFDRTGTNKTNLVSLEEVEFTTNSIIPFPLREGMFYTESVLLLNKTTGKEIDKSEYNFIGTDPFLTAQTGKETAAAIQLIDTGFTGTITVTYQCVGGPEGMANSLLNSLIDAINGAQDGGTWLWELIQNKPSLFPPEKHTHPLSTITELTSLKQALEDVSNALINRIPLENSALSYQEQIDRIIKLQAEMQSLINRVASSGGNTTEINSLRSLIENRHSEIDVRIPVPAGNWVTVESWASAVGVSAKGTIVFTDGTDVESLDFAIVWASAKTPSITVSGNVRTGDKLLTVDAVVSNNNILLRVRSVNDGNAKIKWRELI